MDANQVLIDLVKQVAVEKGATPAQVALAWVLAQKPWIVPIPGTSNMERLKENLGAASIQLSKQELLDLGAALDKIKVTGDRYPADSDAAKRVGK